ncbi:MAG: hypothetical protein U0232_18975 [Thermomicrobiales bacterium]
MTRLVLILALVVGHWSIPVLPGKGVRFFPDKASPASSSRRITRRC